MYRYGTHLQVNKQNNVEKILIFADIWKDTDEKSRIRIRNPVYVQIRDPDPSQNITDMEHWA